MPPGPTSTPAPSASRSRPAVAGPGKPVGSVVVTPTSATAPVGGTVQLARRPGRGRRAADRPRGHVGDRYALGRDGVGRGPRHGRGGGVRDHHGERAKGRAEPQASQSPPRWNRWQRSRWPRPRRVLRGWHRAAHRHAKDAARPAADRTRGNLGYRRAPGRHRVGTGLVTGVAGWTAVVTATSEGKDGTASITVTAAPLSTRSRAMVVT